MINMYLFIIFSIIVIFCFLYASNKCNCEQVKSSTNVSTNAQQPTNVSTNAQQPTNVSTNAQQPTNVSTNVSTNVQPTNFYTHSPSPYLPYDPLYNLYSISPISSLYTYLVEDHPHGFIERGPRGRSPRERHSRERHSRERGPIGGNVIQNFNTNFSGGHTGMRM